MFPILKKYIYIYQQYIKMIIHDNTNLMIFIIVLRLMYVCIYIHMYIYMYIYVYICIYI